MVKRHPPAWRVIAWMCVAHVVSLAGFSTYPALLPGLQSEWGMSGTEAGFLSGLFFAGYMVTVPVLTSLTDRIDARRVYFASSLAAALGSAGFGWLAQGPASGALFQMLVGAGVAGTYMPGLRTLTDNTEGAAQSRGIAFYTAIFGVGMAGSAACTSPAVSAEESLMTRVMCTIDSTTSAYQGTPMRNPNAQVSTPEASMAARITRTRPERMASSFPKMLASGAMAFAMAAIAIGPSGHARSPAPWAAARNATIHERDPNSSQQCTA